MKITYYGHSCFLLESAGYRAVLDPFKDVEGRQTIALTADAVYCSHEHFDHNYREGVLLRNEDIPCPFHVTEISSFHDEVKGAKRGPNIIRIFEAEGLRIAHFGDMGCQLDPDQLALLRNLDLALIPVGGTYTIGPEEAKALIEAIQPVTTIPMHYRNGSAGFANIASLDSFTALFPTVSHQPQSLNLSAKPEGIVILEDQ